MACRMSRNSKHTAFSHASYVNLPFLAGGYVILSAEEIAQFRQRAATHKQPQAGTSPWAPSLAREQVLKEKEPGRLSQNIDELDHHNFLIVSARQTLHLSLSPSPLLYLTCNRH
eukprot:1690146-Pleurochrysis_carterae.AAC.2